MCELRDQCPAYNKNVPTAWPMSSLQNLRSSIAFSIYYYFPVDFTSANPSSCWKAASRSFQVSKVSDYQFAVKKLSWCHGLAQWGGPEGQPQKCQSCYIGTSWPQKCHISTKAHYIKRWSYWIVILILFKIKYLDKNFVIKIHVLSKPMAL